MIKDRYNTLSNAISGINHIQRVVAGQIFDSTGAEIVGPIRLDAAAAVIEQVSRATPALRRALRLAKVDPDTGVEEPGSEGLLLAMMSEHYDGIPPNLLALFLQGRVYSEQATQCYNARMVAARTGGEIDPATGRPTPQVCDGEPAAEFRGYLKALHDACEPLKIDESG